MCIFVNECVYYGYMFKKIGFEKWIFDLQKQIGRSQGTAYL